MIIISISIVRTDQLPNKPTLFPSSERYNDDIHQNQSSESCEMKNNPVEEPSFSHAIPSINLNVLQTRISSFMDTLLKECDHEGVYWIFKQSERNDINVVDLESTEYLESLSEEERIRYIIRLKQFQLDECHRYMHTLHGDDDDNDDNDNDDDDDNDNGMDNDKKKEEKSDQHPYSDTYNTTYQYLLIQSISILDVCLS